MTRLANIVRSAAILAVVALWVLAYALATVVGALADRWHRKDIEAQRVIDGPRAIREATPVDVTVEPEQPTNSAVEYDEYEPRHGFPTIAERRTMRIAREARWRHDTGELRVLVPGRWAA